MFIHVYRRTCVYTPHAHTPPVLGTEHGASCMLSECSTAKLHPSPIIFKNAATWASTRDFNCTHVDSELLGLMHHQRNGQAKSEPARSWAAGGSPQCPTWAGATR